MDSKKIGSLIASLRKEKSMTQKELADKLNVTSKAVSKWETGQGYPEITTIPLLADILGISVGELLNGEICEEKCDDQIEASTIINETVNYLDKTSERRKNIWIMGISILFMFSSLVCILCNYLINGTINWSLYPTGALIMLLVIIFPLFKFKKFKWTASLLGLTITLIPYLFLVEYLAPVKGWVVPLALPVTVISIIALGIIILIFSSPSIKKFYSAGISIIILGVFLELAVQKIVNNFVKDAGRSNISTLVTVCASLIISLGLFAAGYITSKN